MNAKEELLEMEVIKGNEFHAMTEETANELAKAFGKFGNAAKEFEKNFGRCYYNLS